MLGARGAADCVMCTHVDLGDRHGYADRWYSTRKVPCGDHLSEAALRSVPQAGDALASARTAGGDVYTISIAPAAAHLRATRHSEAIEKVRELARGLEFDGWFTCNHTHHARVASFRER